MLSILRDHLGPSALRGEVDGSGFSAWMQYCAQMLDAHYEAHGMDHAARTWRRWTKWAEAHRCFQTHVFARPSAIALATFANDMARGGRAVATGTMRGLEWIRTHLGFSGLPFQPPPLHGTVAIHPPAVFLCIIPCVAATFM